MKIFAVSKTDTRSAGPLPYYIIGDSALTPWRKPLFLPDFDAEFTLRIVPAVIIDRLGKGIGEKFASRYYHFGAFGMLLRAEKMYRHLAENGLPVSAAVSFDSSAFISPQMPVEEVQADFAAGILLRKNGETVATITDSGVKQAADYAISRLSETQTLKTGDTLFLDVPDAGLPIAEGDRIELCRPDGTTIHSFTVK